MTLYDILWRVDIALTKHRGKLYNYIKTTAIVDKKSNAVISCWYTSDIEMENSEVSANNNIVIVFKDEYRDGDPLFDNQQITAMVQFMLFYSGKLEDNLIKAKNAGYMHAYIIDMATANYSYQYLKKYRKHNRG